MDTRTWGEGIAKAVSEVSVRHATAQPSTSGAGTRTTGGPPTGRFRPLTRYAVAVVSSAAAVAVKVVVPGLGGDHPFLLFAGAITVTAWLGGSGPALAATALCSVFAGALSLELIADGSITQFEAALAMLFFIAEGLLITGIAQALHSARRRAEQQQESLREALRFRDEFLSMAAHELRTPVGSLSGFAQLLSRQLRRGGELDRGLLERGAHALDQQSRKLARLVERLLDLSRITEGRLRLEPVVVNLTALVREAVAGIAMTAEKHDIHVSARGGPIEVVADPLAVERIVTNLLDNAVKFNPEGCRIDVEVSMEGNDARIAVRDHGAGVAPDDRRLIFERYRRGRLEHGVPGLGLGLFVSRQIAEQHGGSVELESPPEGGACFVARLPRSRQGP